MTMKELCIQRRDVFNKTLTYRVRSGPVCEIEKKYPNAPTEPKANYVKVNGSFWGVYSSEDGPVFFVDAKEFLLADPELLFVHRKGEEKYFFEVIYRSESIKNILYDPWIVDFDCWSDEDSFDFFISIIKFKDDKKLIEFWTEK